MEGGILVGPATPKTVCTSEAGDNCRDCAKIFGLLVDMLSNAEFQNHGGRDPCRTYDAKDCLHLRALAFNTDGLNEVPGEVAAGDNCRDCAKIFGVLVDMLSNAEFQKKLINGVEDLCVYLPGPDSAQKVCKEELEKILPVAIHIIAAIVRPEDVCKVIGICGPGDRQKVLDNFVSAEVSMTNEKVSATPLCSFCIFLIKTIERLLPKERTEAAVIKVLDEICFILPASLRDQCEDVIGKFGKPVMDALLSYATPQYICTLIHLCKGEEAAHVEPCSLDTYRCRDVPTALKCGTLFYCQRFSWKPLQYGTL